MNLRSDLVSLARKAHRSYYGFLADRALRDAPASRGENLRRLENHLERGDTVLTSGPFRAEISVTSHCTLDCVMCCGPLRDRKLERSWAFFEDYLGAFLDNTIEQVSLVGVGEPTMWPHYLKAVESLSARQITIRTVTNSTIASDKILDSFARHRYSDVHLSVDATGDLSAQIRKGYLRSYSWDVISRNIARTVVALRSNPFAPRVTMNMAVGSYNYHAVPDVVRFAGEVGVDLLTIHRVAIGRIVDRDPGADIMHHPDLPKFQALLSELPTYATVPVQSPFLAAPVTPPAAVETPATVPSFVGAARADETQCILPFTSIQHWHGEGASACCLLPGRMDMGKTAAEFWNSLYMIDLRKRSYRSGLIPGPCGTDECPMRGCFRKQGS